VFQSWTPYLEVMSRLFDVTHYSAQLPITADDEPAIPHEVEQAAYSGLSSRKPRAFRIWRATST
jgi:hypothetical protein